MGERKASSKYIPPDFDPLKLRRRVIPDYKQSNIRFMLPFSVKCFNCNEIMMLGTKVNAKKELCVGKDYLGINVYRFYIHCKSCFAEICIQTDPKNSDYILEKGGTRIFEPQREFEMRGEKTTSLEIEADLEQQLELEKLSQEQQHIRRPKLSDIRKVYRDGELESSFSLSDRQKIRDFNRKNPTDTKNIEVSLEQTKPLGIFTDQSEEF